MNKLYKILISTYFVTTVYTILRYHIFGTVLWKDLFVFTLNKILIFSAVIFLFLLTTGYLNKEAKKILKKTISVSIVLHIIFSTIILKPYYLKGFFVANSGMSLVGNISLLAGSLAAVTFLLKSQIDLKPVVRTKIFVLFVMLHLLAMGLKGWLKPAAWYGGLLPITLISFVLLSIVFFKKINTD